MRISRSLQTLSLLALGTASCTTAALDGTTIGPHGLRVTSTLSAVTLGEDCGQGDAGACLAESPCPSLCHPSGMQIDLIAGMGTDSVTFEVVRARVIESSTDKLFATLTAHDAKQWTGSAYVAWDEKIKPATSSKVSYGLTTPDWSKANADLRAYDTVYRVEVDVLIDGVAITLSIDGVTREPLVAT